MARIKTALTIIVVAILMIIWAILEETYRLVRIFFRWLQDLLSFESRKENHHGYD